jgi:cell division protein FtsQ
MSQVGFRREGVGRASQLRQKRQGRTARATRQSFASTTRATWEPGRRAPVSRARRRYDIALGQPGVEVSLPGIPLSFNARTLAIALALLCGAGMLLFLSGAAFEAGTPEVQGNNYLPAEIIASAAGVQGKNVFSLSPRAVNTALVTADPGVRQARMSIGWPNRVILTVEERVPILAWQQGTARFWVDAEGVFFVAPGDREGLVAVDVPEAGPEVRLNSQPSIEPQVVSGALQLMAAFPEMAPVVYDARRGLGLHDPRGWAVYFGTATEVGRKADLYQRVISGILARGVTPQWVSVEDLRQPYYHE